MWALSLLEKPCCSYEFAFPYTLPIFLSIGPMTLEPLRCSFGPRRKSLGFVQGVAKMLFVYGDREPGATEIFSHTFYRLGI